MISRDADLISEAYLSAIQKSPNYPGDPAMKSVAEVNPEVTDRENVENKPAIVVSVPEALKPWVLWIKVQVADVVAPMLLMKSLKNIGWFVQISFHFIQTQRRFTT